MIILPMTESLFLNQLLVVKNNEVKNANQVYLFQGFKESPPIIVVHEKWYNNLKKSEG